MKTFTLLAVTGGLFFTSLCLNNSKSVKKSRVCLKTEVSHCIKKGCNNAKKAKASNTNISKRAVNAHS